MDKLKGLLKKHGTHILIEIFIIVMGVLIALQVNNWNQARQQKKHLKGIVKKVMDDLEADTLLINAFHKHYDPFIKEYDVVIKQEVTDEYLDTCRVCISLITIYSPFKAESSGLELLKNYVNNHSAEIQSDTTIINFIHSHSQIIEIVNQMAKRVKDDIDVNVTKLSNQEWFADFYTAREAIPSFREYYKSDEFRNDVVRHKMFVHNNLYNLLTRYKQFIIETLPKLKERHDKL